MDNRVSYPAFDCSFPIVSSQSRRARGRDAVKKVASAGERCDHAQRVTTLVRIGYKGEISLILMRKGKRMQFVEPAWVVFTRCFFLSDLDWTSGHSRFPCQFLLMRGSPLCIWGLHCSSWQRARLYTHRITSCSLLNVS